MLQRDRYAELLNGRRFRLVLVRGLNYRLRWHHPGDGTQEIPVGQNRDGRHLRFAGTRQVMNRIAVRIIQAVFRAGGEARNREQEKQNRYPSQETACSVARD